MIFLYNFVSEYNVYYAQRSAIYGPWNSLHEICSIFFQIFLCLLAVSSSLPAPQSSDDLDADLYGDDYADYNAETKVGSSTYVL